MKPAAEPQVVPMPDALRRQAGLRPRSGDAAAVADRERRSAYAAAWERTRRALLEERARAAAVAVRFGAARPEHVEAVARMREVSDEFDRVSALYRRGAPFTARTWAPLAGAGAGTAPADRSATKRADLFSKGPVDVTGQDGFDDILDALGG